MVKFFTQSLPVSAVTLTSQPSASCAAAFSREQCLAGTYGISPKGRSCQQTPTSQRGAPCPLAALGAAVWAESSRTVLLGQPALTIFHRRLMITQEGTLLSRTMFAWCLIRSQKVCNSVSWAAAINQGLIPVTINTPSFKLLDWNPE